MHIRVNNLTYKKLTTLRDDLGLKSIDSLIALLMQPQDPHPTVTARKMKAIRDNIRTPLQEPMVYKEPIIPIMTMVNVNGYEQEAKRFFDTLNLNEQIVVANVLSRIDEHKQEAKKPKMNLEEFLKTPVGFENRLANAQELEALFENKPDLSPGSPASIELLNKLIDKVNEEVNEEGNEEGN